MHLAHLTCTACDLEHPADILQNLCRSCGKPLLARYDLAAGGKTLTREALKTREKSFWRYLEVLPLKGLSILDRINGIYRIQA